MSVYSFVEIRGIYGVKKGKKRVEEALMDLAEECLALGKKERQEKQWMKKMYDRFRVQNGQIGKAAADELLFRRMYAAEPGKTVDTLKIRYWRIGRHMRVSRD